MKGRTGFTIIEVLVATIILGVLIGSLVGPLGGLFRMTQRNQQLLDNTTLAQQVVEKIVREWQDSARFSKSCVRNSVQIPSGVTVTIQNLDSFGNPVAQPEYSLRSCGSSPDSVPLKRVKVVANANGGTAAVIVMDIARPQP